MATPKPFEIVLANSGVTVNTAALDEFLDAQKSGEPELFAARLKKLTGQVFEMEGRRSRPATLQPWARS